MNNNLPLAALSTVPSPLVSERYRFIDTHDIVTRLIERHDWEVVSAAQYGVKDSSQQAFAKHVVRIRPPKHQLYQVGDLIPEITITNAHHRGVFNAIAGAFTCFCLNQCLKPVHFLQSEAYFRHQGRIAQSDVIEGVYRVLARSVEWVDQLTEWNKIPISIDDSIHFAEQALLLRWPQGNSPVTVQQALRPRYREETTATLGAVYNRLHNLAQHGFPRPQKGRVARALRNDSFLKFNQGLAELAEGFVQ